MGRNESSSGTVENCYYLKGEGYPDTGIGGEKDTTGQAEGKNNDAFESGAVAYLLNGSNSEDTAVWRQNLDNGAVPDRFPVPDDSHGVVYEVEDGEDVRYSNSADGTWTISGCTVTLSAYTFTYDGKEQMPKVESVQWGEEKKPLTEGTDYTVTLPKSKDADTYTVTITGKGTYAGEVEVTYTIEKATLTAAYVGETVPAGGSPKLVVTVDGFVNGETADTAAG